MPSLYMPDVEVHIAFNAGYTTPAASRTWTDVSTYVELHEGIDIDFGRQDERATAGANTLSLTLDNTDGRFTAMRAASPYYPNVKIGRPIRVRVTPPGGSVVTRFVGFIDEWPVEWDGTDSYAKAKIRASSRLARLGLNASLRSMIENEIQQDRPTQFYTLGDVAGSTAALDSSGSAGAARLLLAGSGAALTFGTATGPATDDLTAVVFAGGQYLAYDGAAASSGTAQSLECFMLRSGVPATRETLITTFPISPSAAGIMVRILTTGLLEVRSSTSLQLTSTVNVCDDATHHIAVTRAGATWNLYIDGVLDATTGAGSASAITSWVPMVGGPESPPGDPITVVPFTGTIAHAAFWSATTLSATRVAAHADDSGGEGERTDQRVVRALAWVGVLSAEITAETGVETMTYQKTGGSIVVDVLRGAESTEGGVLFDRPDGNVGFHNRSHRYLAGADVTLNMASQHVESDYAPKLDRSTLVNDATVSNPTTGESARAIDSTSSDEYGVATTSATSVADTYDPLQQKASWLVASYAEPHPRVPSLTVDVLAHQGLTPSAQDLLAVTLGDLITVEDQPLQSPFPGGDWLLGGGTLGEVILGDAPSAHLFVEGYTETIGTESYSLTFNLSPTYPTLNTFVLDDAVRGELDADNVLAY